MNRTRSASSSHCQAATVRSSLYRLLADLLSYPGGWIKSGCENGKVNGLVSALIDGLPYKIKKPRLTNKDFEQMNMESEYLRLFELPSDNKPCALYGGIYGGNRQQLMEELLRYYRFFGLSTSNAKTVDLPDSIPTLLEFFQYLAYKESISVNLEDKVAVRLAQHDLLRRHLTQWLPLIIEKLNEKNPLPFYRDTVQLLDSFATAEMQMLST